MRSLKGKTVLITGSSSGIGKETAILFSKEGCRLILTYHKNKKGCEETAKECGKNRAEVMLVRLDLTDDASIREAVKKIVKSHSTIYCLINNAGVISWKPLISQTYEDIALQIRTNLEGMIKLTKSLLPHITGCIINVGSGAGKAGYANLTAYCATKFGVRGFTQSLAQEIEVPAYSVNPDMTATRMTGFKGRDPKEVAKVILNSAKGTYMLPSGSDVDVWERA